MKFNIVDNRKGNRARKADASSHKNEMVVDDIMRTGDQSKGNEEEVEVVESFRQHVESERGQLIALLKQARAKEYVSRSHSLVPLPMSQISEIPYICKAKFFRMHFLHIILISISILQD